MKERPILFSGEMVKAILDWRKTQTRRVVGIGNSTVLARKPRSRQAKEWADGWLGLDWENAHKDGASSKLQGRQSINFFGAGRNAGFSCGEYLHVPLLDDEDDGTRRVRSLHQPGDRLWVRETWAADRCYDHLKPSEIPETAARIYYESGSERMYTSGWHLLRNPRFMPRWASRITLEITEVRVHRLQEISEEDAEAEGVEKLGSFPDITPWRNYSLKPGQPHCLNFSIARRSFETLWDSINAKKHPWASNPWVWAISFRRVQP